MLTRRTLVPAVLGIGLVFPAAARGVIVPVFILAGQSNMDGRGHTSDIAGIRPALNVTQSAPGDSVQISYDGYQSSGTFAWMAPGNSGGAEGAGGANEFGCELSLGQDLAKNNFPTQTVYLIKVSMGGTTLAGDWKPGTGANYLTGCGSDWATLVNYSNAALTAITAAGNTPVIKGILWHQGESDGQSLTNAQNYDAHLRTFLTDVRDVFHAYTVPDMPFFVGSMGNITNGSYPYDNTYIYNAEKSVSVSLGSIGGVNYTQDVNVTYDPSGYNPVANTYFVNFNDLVNDGLHFNSASYVTMGDRFAATYALVATPEPGTLVLLGIGGVLVPLLRRKQNQSHI